MLGWRARIAQIAPCPAENEPYYFYQIAPPGVGLVVTALSVQEINARSLNTALAQPLLPSADSDQPLATTRS